jgi:hypothetical protein
MALGTVCLDDATKIGESVKGLGRGIGTEALL